MLYCSKEVIFVKCDCHIHMVLDGLSWKQAIARHEQQPAEEFIHITLREYQSKGYTYLRDGGDRWGAGKRARELAAAYGITELPAAVLVNNRGTIIARMSTLEEVAQKFKELF